MGMDLVAIIEHKKTAEEILKSPKIIDNAKNFREVYRQKFPTSDIRDAKWNGPYTMTIENLEKIWILEENKKDSSIELEGSNYYAELDIPYAVLTFHRNTISISPHGLIKYGNFRTPEWATFIIKMNRELAKIFNSNKIVYCVDSYEPQSLLYDYCLEGKLLENIIEIGNEKFGKPPKEINKAVKNLYFIDDFNLVTDELVEWNWNDIGL